MLRCWKWQILNVPDHSENINFWDPWSYPWPVWLIELIIEGNIFAHRTCAQILQNVDQNSCQRSKNFTCSHCKALAHKLGHEMVGMVKISALKNTAKWIKMKAKAATLPTFGIKFGQQVNKARCFTLLWKRREAVFEQTMIFNFGSMRAWALIYFHPFPLPVKMLSPPPWLVIPPQCKATPALYLDLHSRFYIGICNL